MTGAAFGVYRQPRAGWTQADWESSMSQLESQLGRHVDIDHHYYQWTKVFPSWMEPWDEQNGRTSMISWAGTSTTSITSGTYDAMIATRADALRQFGHPVFLRWFWEMDAKSNAANAVSPSSYIAAWRHIHDIFVQHGATNVMWVWCPESSGFRTGTAQQFYPGDQYVDWICADGYNWAPSSGTWRSFHDIFNSFYAWASARGKPLMVGETGTQEDTVAGHKAQWIGDIAATMKTSFPAIRAFLYFDARATSYTSGTTYYDWRVDTSTSSLSAFVALANDPYFSGGLSRILASS